MNNSYCFRKGKWKIEPVRRRSSVNSFVGTEISSRMKKTQKSIGGGHPTCHPQKRSALQPCQGCRKQLTSSRSGKEGVQWLPGTFAHWCKRLIQMFGSLKGPPRKKFENLLKIWETIQVQNKIYKQTPNMQLMRECSRVGGCASEQVPACLGPTPEGRTIVGTSLGTQRTV